MKLRATFQIPRLSLAAYRAALQEQLVEAISRAAFEWLVATTELIPVWSGASMATFRPLASEIEFGLNTSPRGGVRDRTNLGLSNADGEVDVAEAGNGRVSFTYTTTLPHLIYNEFNNANITPDPTLFFRLLQPGPYQFQEAGRNAFRKVAADIRLPNPFKSITVKPLRVS